MRIDGLTLWNDFVANVGRLRPNRQNAVADHKPRIAERRRSLRRKVEPLEQRLVLSGTALELQQSSAPPAALSLEAIQSIASIQSQPTTSPHRWLVRLDPTVSSPEQAEWQIDQFGLADAIDVRNLGVPGLFVFTAQPLAGPVQSSGPVTTFAQQIEAGLDLNPHVISFERDSYVGGQFSPNDPAFVSNELIGLRNPGVNGGIADSDTDAEEAWDLTTGNEHIAVALVDSGIDYTHPDLYLNVWLNQGEIPAAMRTLLVDVDANGLITFRDLNLPANAAFVSDLNANGYIDGGDLLADSRWENGLDEDGNLKTDDLIGWNFRENNNDPRDTHGHGTHVAGTIGALGNNGLGVAGFNWQVQLVACRFLANVAGQGLTGSRTDAIAAIAYTTALAKAGVPIRVSNNSWGAIEDPSPELRSVIEANNAAGVLFVAAAGNGEGRTGRGIDLDTERLGFYPASFDLPGIVSVAASDARDNLAIFSQYGKTSIDLAAPGVGILSTDLNGTYSVRNGTSMATPHVAGTAALLFGLQPDATVAEAKNAIVKGVDAATGLTNRVVTNGRLNTRRTIAADVFAPKVAVISITNVYNEATAYEFTVQISDSSGVDLNSLATATSVKLDVPESPTLSAVISNFVADGDLNTPGDQPRVTYRITPPGGAWDQGDNGRYEVHLANSVISDLATPTVNKAPGRLLGTFVVDIQYAGEIDVTTFADGADSNPNDPVSDIGNGQSTLRAAIQTANFRNGANTIVLQPGTYTLTLPGADEDAAATGDLDITDELLIHGNGAVIEVTGGIDRLFDVMATGKLTLRDVTLQNGNAGSASGGGLRQQGGTVEVFNSLFIGNTAASGGAIAQTAGAMSLTNTTVSGNSATQAAGLDASGGSLSLLHVTMTANTASDTTGGLRQSSSGSVSLTNTLIAANSATNGDPDLTGAIATATHSLIGVLGSGTGITHGGSGNQVGTTGSPIDPQLGPLTQRTGLTRGHEPRSGSPAVDTASATFVTAALETASDQRGIARSQNGDEDAFKEPDIGAIERFYADISGIAYQDTNDNGKQDPNEPGIPGVAMTLDLNNNGVADAGEPTQITASDNPATTSINEAGRYSFEGLDSGRYGVLQQTGVGFEQLSPKHDTNEAVFDLTRLTSAAGGNGSEGLIFNGDASSDNLGKVIADAGDFNGDGFSDIYVVGRSHFIIYGQASFPIGETTPQIDLLPGYAMTRLVMPGGTLTNLGGAVGDVDADGATDFIVGASIGTVNTAFLIYGKRGPVPVQITLTLGGGENYVQLNGPSVLGSFVAADARAYGDINKDGISDFILSYPNARPGGRIDAGQVVIVYGSTSRLTGSVDLVSMSNGRRVLVNGTAPGDLLGARFKLTYGTRGQPIASSGDVDNDGYDDVVIGAYKAFRQSVPAGEAYVVFGSPELPDTIELSALASSGHGIIIRSNRTGRIGGFVATGDIDSDGAAEIAIGEAFSGPVRVIHGGQSLRQIAQISLPQASEAFTEGTVFSATSGEHGVDTVGDFNGDGYCDIIISDENADLPTVSNVGKVHIVLGRELSTLPIGLSASETDGSRILTLIGISPNDEVGHQISGIGDINGDGFADVLVSAEIADPSGDQSGQAYVVFGRRNPELGKRDGYFLVDAHPARSITGADFGYRPMPAMMSGTVYRDVNIDGIRDANEAGLAGIRVYVDADRDGVFDTGELTATTDAAGIYTISNVPALVEAQVRIVGPSGFTQTQPSAANSGLYQFTPGAGETKAGLDFGFSDVTGGVGVGTGNLTGRVFADGNRNGLLDNGESGLSGVTVFLDINDNGLLDETPAPEPRQVTASDDVGTPANEAGNYSFSGLAAQDYVVRIAPSVGQVQTGPRAAAFTSSNVSAGDGPVAAVPYFYNGDAFPDLIVATSGRNDLLVQLNNGDGTYAAPVSIASTAVKAVLASPRSMVSGDLNGDGKLDLVVGNFASNKPAVLLSDGAGGFTPASVPSVGTLDASSVTLGQFSIGDSSLDLAVASEFGNSVYVLRNNGSGGFTLAATLTPGNAPVDVAGVDLNNDARTDLVVANRDSNTLRTFLLQSNGTFQTADPGGIYTKATGSGPFRLATGDFDGDTFQDVVVANVFESRISLFRNRQTGAFFDATHVRVGQQPASVVTSDFNNDGLLDIAATTVSATGFSILFNLGGGVFQAPTTQGVASLAQQLAPSLVSLDVDADGDEDLGVLKPERNSGRLFIERNSFAAGQYRVSVAADATVSGLHFGLETLNSPPTVTEIADVTLNEDAATSALSFTIGDLETAATDLVVTATSSNTGLVPTSNIVIAGSGANRTVTVTPAANQSGTVLVTLAISDGTTSAFESFNVTVNPVNDAPTLSSLANLDLQEDAAGGSVTFTIGDLETAAASLTLTKASSNTSLIPTSNIVFGGAGTARSVTVVPAANANGSATITVTLSDGLLTATRTFVVTVSAVNDAPTIGSISDVTVSEDTASNALSVSIADTETSSSSLTLSATSTNTALIPVANIVFGGSGSSRTVRVTPAANLTGTSTIAVTVSDGTLTATRNFNVTVTAVNDGPTISAIGDMRLLEDSASDAVSFTLGDIDTAIGSLTLNVGTSDSLLLPLQNIEVTGSGANRTLRVTPVANRAGTVTVSLSVSDGSLSYTELVDVIVDPVDDAPTLTAPSDVTFDEDTASETLSFTVGDFDTPIANLTVSAVSSNADLIPASGLVLGGSAAARTVRLIPRPDQFGTSTITVTVTDGTTPVTRSFVATVEPVNDGPSLSSFSDVVLLEDTASSLLSFSINDFETAGSSLTVTATSSNSGLLPESQLVLSGTGASRHLRVTPALNRSGSGIVSVTVSDGDLSATQTFVVTVLSVNDAPTISNLTAQTIQEDARLIDLPFSISDVDSTGLSVTATSSELGLVRQEDLVIAGSGTTRRLTVTPLANQAGVTTITLTVSDGELTASQSFELTVSAVNDAPTIGTIADVSTDEDVAVTRTVTVGDLDTSVGNLVLSAVSSNTGLVPQANVSFEGSGATRTVRVVPAANQFGSTTITVSVSDGTNSAQSAFVVTVLPVNDGPTIAFLSDVMLNEDESSALLPVTLSDLDTNAAVLVVTVSSSNATLLPVSGIDVSGAGANRFVRVTPAANQTGTATVTLSVSDGTLSASRAFVVTVAAVNDAPTIGTIADVSTDEDVAVTRTVTVGDLDTSLGNLVLTAVSSNTGLVPHANVSFEGSGATRTVRIVPAVNQFGSTTITVSVSDGTNSAQSAFVVTVLPVNDGPTIASLSDVMLNEDESSALLPVSLSDLDTNAAVLVVTASSSNATLLPVSGIEVSGAGANRFVRVTPAANQTGTATVTLSVSDGTLSASRAFVVTVAAVNDTPSMSPISNVSIVENTSTAELPFSISDLESAAAGLLLLVSSSEPGLVPVGNVVLSGSGADRAVRVTPVADRTGSATITLTVSDGLATASQSFVVTVGAADEITLSHINAVTLLEDTASDEIPFEIAVPASTSGELLVSINSSNTTLVPLSGIALIGSGLQRAVRVTPASNASGSTDITVQVTDGTLTATETFTVTVAAVDDAPVVGAIGAVAIAEDSATSAIGFSISDVDTPVANLMVRGISSDIELVPNSNIVITGSGGERFVTVTPLADRFGTTTIAVQVSDGTRTVSREFQLTVTPTNDAPSIGSLSDISTSEDAGTVSVGLTIGDIDHPANALIVTATASDSELVPIANLQVSGSGTARTLQVTPASDRFGSATITVSVSDGTATTETSFRLNVAPVNDAPQISAIDDVSLLEDETSSALSFTVSDLETAGSELQVSVSSSNPNLIPISQVMLSGIGFQPVISATGETSGSPDTQAATPTVSVRPIADRSGSATITLTVSDGQSTSRESFNVVVTPINDLPTISALPDTSVGRNAGPVELTFQVSDLETPAGSLQVAVESSNSDLVPVSGIAVTGSGANRALLVQPRANQSGTSVISLTVNDGTDSVREEFLLTVTGSNAAPVLTTPQAIDVPENQVVVLIVAAEDGDSAATALSYSLIASSPDAAAFEIDTSTGVLSFLSEPDFETPTDANGDNVYEVDVAVSDGEASSSQRLRVRVTDVTLSRLVELPEAGSRTEVRLSEGLIVVTAGSNVLLAERAEDLTELTVQGGAGDDVIVLDASLQASALTTLLVLGGTGNDEISASGLSASLPVELNGEAGDDRLTGGLGNDVLRGGTGRDVLNGEAGLDELLGEDGDDTLQGGLDADVLDGGDGRDQVTETRNADFRVLAAQLIVSASSTNSSSNNAAALLSDNSPEVDTLLEIESALLVGGVSGNRMDASASEMPVELYGGPGQDSLIGSRFGDTLNGQSGNDVMEGADGGDLVIGGTGTDIVRGTFAFDVTVTTTATSAAGLMQWALTSMQGVSVLSQDSLATIEWLDLTGSGTRNRFDLSGFAGALGATINGAGGNDEILGSPGSDVIFTGTGADSINGLGGADAIFAGAGNDSISGGEGFDNLNGQNGNDLIFGESGNDVLVGGAGIDTLNGGDGNDYLLGQSEAGVLNGGNGNDTLQGNGSNDTLRGDAGNDKLFGMGANDRLDGGDGDDSLLGGTGADTVLGGTGNDTLQGDAGNDSLDGGADSDRVSEMLDGNLTIDSISTPNVTKLTSSVLGSDSLVFIERINVMGGSGDNFFDGRLSTISLFLMGSGGRDTLYGGLRNDFLSGGDGDDILNGGAGHDTLEGGEGDDGLSGYTGNDSLVGGNGRDTLFGHSGSDTLRGGAGDDLLLGAGGSATTTTDGPDLIDGGEGSDTVGTDASNLDSVLADPLTPDTFRDDLFVSFPNWVELL